MKQLPPGSIAERNCKLVRFGGCSESPRHGNSHPKPQSCRAGCSAGPSVCPSRVSPSPLIEDSRPVRFLKYCHMLLEAAHSDLQLWEEGGGFAQPCAPCSLVLWLLAGGNEEGAGSVLLVAELWEVDWEGEG